MRIVLLMPRFAFVVGRWIVSSRAPFARKRIAHDCYRDALAALDRRVAGSMLNRLDAR